MTLPLTRDQRRAVHTLNRNLVLLAAAGSGKTHVLVERMLALLDARPDWPLHSLVAITFTRKAAREMRERLRYRLRERALNAGKQDGETWRGHLAAVDDACIGTIHSLCTRILRAGAAEARLDPEFSVMEADEAALALDAALEDALQQLAETDDPALALFAEYDRNQVVAALRDQVPLPAPDPVPEDVLQRWQAGWESDAAERLKEFRASTEFRDLLARYRNQDWPEGDKLGLLFMQRGEVLEALGAETEIAAAIELIRDLHVKAGNNGSVKNWGSDAALKDARARFNALSELARTLSREIGEGIDDLDRRAARLLPLWRRLVLQVREVYRAGKRKENRLDFNDLEELAYEALQRPDLRERLRREFRHILVDEFHDTSPLQWEIIRALADPREPGRLFIVGDPRQSIYGFRGADVGNFNRALDEVSAAGGLQLSLSQSFRSHQPLLDVLNHLHRTALPRGPHEPLVTERRQAPGVTQPALELLLMDRKAAELNAEEGRARLARELARRLRDLVAGRCPVLCSETGEIRPLRYGDVALLFRRHHRMPDYEEAFRELGLPFVTLGGRGFYGRQEVLDLLNLLRALRNPADDLALASVLRSPLFALSDEALLKLRLPPDGEVGRPSLWDALQRPAALSGANERQARFARDCLGHLALLAGRVSVEELLQKAMQRTGYLATLGGLRDGDRRRGNVEKLLAVAAARPRLFTEFEDLLRDFTQREVREGDAASGSEGAITLLTVHNGKGLEFPLVVLAEVSKWQAPRDASVLARDREGRLACRVFDMAHGGHRPTFASRAMETAARQEDLDETRRLFYVASTRARDYLIVCASQDGSPGEAGWLGWLHEALDLDRREPHHAWRIGQGQVLWRDLAATADAALPSQELARDGSAAAAVATLTGDQNATRLLRPLPPKSPGLLREISVTDLSQHFERALVREAGAAPLTGDREERRMLGDVLHQALRAWRPGAEADSNLLQGRVESLLWQRGLRDPWRRAALLRQVMALLASFEAGALAARMKTARRTLRELPFMQRHGDCLLQGSIDLLMQEADGAWTLVDFKTADLGAGAGQDVARSHARRYWLQLGLYAGAVTRRPDVDPSALTVLVHYPGPGLDVIVPTADWQQALAELDDWLAREGAAAGAAG